MGIKILHTGDIHLGDLNGPTKDGKNLRREDTLRCMDEIVNQAEAEKPHLAIIAGDLFNRSRVWADTALDDVNDAISRFIRPLCAACESVALLFGTMNHDNPRAFETIEKATGDLKNLRIYTTPRVERIDTSAGAVQILAVPGFDKGRIRLFCPGLDKEDENRNATALVNDIILGLSGTLDKTIPTVLTAHYTVSGSEADNGTTFLAGQDVVILPATVDAAGVALACFGHIHRPQRLVCSVPAYYCGSPNQLTFNDEDTAHGFYVHEIVPGGDPDFPAPTDWYYPTINSRFIPTPERKHYTYRMTAEEVTVFINAGQIARKPAELEGAIVRVRYTCTAEQDKAFNRAELQKQLMAAGAFHVSEIIPEDIEDLDAKDQLTEQDGPAECLARWLEINDIRGTTADRLMELAAPIIRRADDGRDANEHTGAFIPRMIEVKNYRSYTEAAFDFGPVKMAMVNGQNGVGKSSLFMDALADCLYEQSRKEDIGGWVRDGTKSGSITFTFGMGGQEYRVIRTRTKSGRGTLALQRFDTEAGDWADESDTTMKLTQAKIERLLGMDCNTFCSIALIRQDAYGLFLEADSDRRMEVLSALLGLDIYTRMEEIAKAGATEQRRKIAATKERINILDEQTRKKESLIAEDADLAIEAGRLQDRITATEASLEAAQKSEALRQEITRQHTEKIQQAGEYAAEIERREGELAQLEKKCQDARLLHNGLSAAQAASSAVKDARATIAQLQPDLELYRSLTQERSGLANKLDHIAGRQLELRRGREAHQATLAMGPEIAAAQEAIAALQPRIAEAQARLEKSIKARFAMEDAKSAVDNHVAESRIRIAALTEKVNAAKAEAGRIADSGCTAPAGASCKFLASARQAEKDLPGLQEQLANMKAADRATYERLQKTYQEAQAEYSSYGDPNRDLMNLNAEERRHQAVANKAASLAAAEAKLEEIAAELERITQEQGDTHKRIAEIDAKTGELAVSVQRHSEALAIIQNNEALADTLAVCMEAKALIDALEPQIERAAADIADLKKKRAIAALEAQDIAARIPTEVPQTAALRSSLEALRQEVTSLATERGQIAAKMEAITKAEEQITGLRREVEAIASGLQDYTTLVQAFGLDGIQYMIIRGVVPEIMRRSNDILASMTGGRMAVDIRTEREQKSTKQIVNSLEVWINTITGGTRPYLSHSGGEKVRISLAVTLGLADVKAHRTGVQLGMLWIDEPPFLDAEGTEAYADALCSMARRNPEMRILAISHDPAMKGRFEQNIIVTGGENGSTVTME